MKKKIGIIGSGIVGQVLANGFIKYGHEVMIGTGDVSKHDALRDAVNGASVGSFEACSMFGDIIVLAVKGTIVASVLQKIGIEHLEGKTIIDTTNPIADAAPVNGVLQYFTSYGESLLEILQKAVPEANFVKAFNSVGNAFMVNPDFGGIKPTMFICGNNDAAKKEVSEIIDLFGWETEDMGMSEAARAIEPLCMLWCIPGMRKNEWNHAFKLLKK